MPPSERPAAPAAPAYLRPGNLLLVFAGGAVGVLLRELLMLAVPDVELPGAGMLPLAVLSANVVGSFLLGLLLEWLARAGDALGGGAEHQRHRALRLLLGTGVLGGFTTYSALAQAADSMLRDGNIALAVGYGLGSLVAGLLAAWLGIALAARIHLNRRASPDAAKTPSTGVRDA